MPMYDFLLRSMIKTTSHETAAQTVEVFISFLGSSASLAATLA